MVRRRRTSSPPPPSPPRRKNPAKSVSNTEEEGVETPRAAATQMPPPNPRSQPPPAASDGDDSSEDESDSGDDAQNFKMQPAAAPLPESESDSDDEEEDEEGEDGQSSESDPEIPEQVLEAPLAAPNKSKTAEPKDKKRPAPDLAPSGGAKKTKSEAGKAALEATPAASKRKKAKAAPEKLEKSGGKREKRRLDLSPSSKSVKRPRHTWSFDDSIRILEAMATHVASQAAMADAEVVLAAVGKSLDRQDCSRVDMYEKIRTLQKWYEKKRSKGPIPTEGDDLRLYNLSEAVWGEEAQKAVAASKNGSTATKSKKGQSKKGKMDENSKGATLNEAANANGSTQKVSKKGLATEVKTDRDEKKKKLSKDDTTTGTPIKSKKEGNDKEELGKGAKGGASKEGATQNGDALTNHKMGETDKDKVDKDVMPMEVATSSQNAGEEAHQEETEVRASVQGPRRSFDELQDLYPSLAGCVKTIRGRHSCGEALARAFEFIVDERANALETTARDQSLIQLKAQNHREDMIMGTVGYLLGLED